LDFENKKFGDYQIPPKKKVFVIYDDTETLLKEKITVPLEKGDIVIWNNNLPHAGGINRNPDRWRLQAFTRYLALDGPSISLEDKKINNDYRTIVNQCVKSGKTPARFPTGNRVPRQSTIEVDDHKFPQLSNLGKKLLGQVKWDF